MSFVRRLLAMSSRDGSHRDSEDISRWEIAADERIGAPLARRRGQIYRRGFALLFLLGLGYLSYEDPSILPRYWTVLSDLAAPFVQQAMQAPAPSAAPKTSSNNPEQPPKAIGDAVPSQVLTPTRPVEHAGNPIFPTKSIDTPPAGPTQMPASPTVEMPAYSPPQLATVVDPYEARAKAAGLHPDLSRALLMRLSDVDFRNAEYATRTAVSKTPDNATFKWPNRRETGVATFEVHFVPGAAPDCRRYVVTVEKDRWLTTAPPVDKCGARSRGASQ